MADAKRMHIGQVCIYSTVNRFKKCNLRRGGEDGVSRQEKKPFTALDNLSDYSEGSTTMAYRRPTFDLHGKGSATTAGDKLPVTHKAKIKEKISLWEGKESAQTPAYSTPPGPHRNANSNHHPVNMDRVDRKERQYQGKENTGKVGDSGPPGSPVEHVKQLGRPEESERPSYEKSRRGGEDSGLSAQKERQRNGTEVTGKAQDLRPCSPAGAAMPQVRTLRKRIDQRTGERSNQEKRAVFKLFRKMEQATGDTQGRTPSELGNYFSPTTDLPRTNESGPESRPIGASKSLGSRGQRWPHEENVYNEPGAQPINPVPKPQRTFLWHRQGKGLENLPPLPPVSPPPAASLPGTYRRSRGTRTRDALNRKSFEFEDLPVSQGQSVSPIFPKTHQQEHHYEDVLDLSNENPYEDIEVDSQCSQQSLPSSPSAESTKGSRPGFFRQNSGRSFKLLDLRRVPRRREGRALSQRVPSPQQISPGPSLTRLDQVGWLAGDPCGRLCRRIPTVVLKINSIFEARIGKKHLRRSFHYVESSSGPVTDENSDSESEVEERAKVQKQRLNSFQSILSKANQNQVHCNSRNSMDSSLEKAQKRQLFEYFLVVSLQKARAGAPYLPVVTQQFPLKLERSFTFMRETEDQLRIVPQFCFPDSRDWEPVESYPSEMFSFVLTGEDGSRRFGYCRRLLASGRGKRLPEVYCIVSHLGCFNLFSKVLDEVETRRALSPALVQPFMRAIMEAQFPAPGRTITLKTFLPGSGMDVIELCRPPDTRLEHVDFECLFSCLSLRLLLRVLGSLLLERRVIFTSDKLSTLSQCCHAVVALLYPFVWQHTYIPVLPSAMLDIVCTPTPFIVGLLSTSLPQLTELPLEEVLVVDLGNDRFLRQMDDEDAILPSKLQYALENVLERRRELANERAGDFPEDTDHLSTVVSEAFVRFFLELVGHYPLFITGEREDGYSSSSSSPVPSLFHQQGFRKAVPSKSVRRFLDVFMETQMFGWFIQERELHQQAFKGLFEVRVQEYMDSIRDNEHWRVNKFLKGLGNKMKFLSKK